MRVVVADATPLHYLILIEAVHVLPRLFERIDVPAEVRDELIHQATPSVVRTCYPPSLMETLLHEESNRRKGNG
jgi:predicted nucleic acid-binding protein